MVIVMEMKETVMGMGMALVMALVMTNFVMLRIGPSPPISFKSNIDFSLVTNVPFTMFRSDDVWMLSLPSLSWGWGWGWD